MFFCVIIFIISFNFSFSTLALVCRGRLLHLPSQIQFILSVSAARPWSLQCWCLRLCRPSIAGFVSAFPGDQRSKINLSDRRFCDRQRHSHLQGAIPLQDGAEGTIFNRFSLLWTSWSLVLQRWWNIELRFDLFLQEKEPKIMEIETMARLSVRIFPHYKCKIAFLAAQVRRQQRRLLYLGKGQRNFNNRVVSLSVTF